MIYTMSGAEALARRQVIISPGTGLEHWGTEWFGPRTSRGPGGPGPQATMSEMAANEVIVSHFHCTTQFQLFVAGEGTLGKKADPIRPLMVQYKDPCSAYGPVVAGPQGLSFMALRIKTDDSAPVYIDKPGYREKLRPTKRRNWVSDSLKLSTEPIMKFRKEKSVEALYDQSKIDDEMQAYLVRLGAGQSHEAPDPNKSAGYYVFVANGTMMQDDREMPLWSMVVVHPGESPYEIRAGEKGLEALILQYPKED
jgi:hypothetical protein